MSTCPPCPMSEADCERDGCEAMATLTAELTAGRKRYRTIVVDPPWPFIRELPERHFLYRADREGRRRTAQARYSLMSIEQIAALPIGEWAPPENAHLYLWTTNTFMVEAHELMALWGFAQKTILTWVKPRLGMGTYYRNNTEHVLFGVRPKSPTHRNDCRTAFTAEQGSHSEKPPAFYDIVESMSPGPYLDVFARKLRFNWDAWGDEVGAPPGLPTPDDVRARAPADKEVT